MTMHRPTPLWIVIGLAMGPAVALGLARFAYALLLPAMRTELGWSYADAGAVNTANAAGYLAGALGASAFCRRFGDKQIFAAALVATAVSIAAPAFTESFRMLLLLRLIAGFTGALAFVSGAGLVSAAATGSSPTRASRMLGTYFAGGGMGITASALAVPPLVLSTGWRGGWFALSMLALLATGFAITAVSRLHVPKQVAVEGHQGGWSLRLMPRMLFAYCLFGAGYVAYMTFIIAYLRGEGHLSDAFVSFFWALLGLAAVAGAFAWAPLLGRLKASFSVAATIGTVTIGAATPLLWHGMAGAIMSAVLFGGSFLTVIAAVTMFARRALRPHVWTAAIAALTTAFGFGQCVGPLLSGELSDGPGGIRAGLWLSVGILAGAAAIAALHPDMKAKL